eukprot:jgi/Psemu1/40470/gm1.40470_g
MPTPPTPPSLCFSHALTLWGEVGLLGGGGGGTADGRRGILLGIRALSPAQWAPLCMGGSDPQAQHTNSFNLEPTPALESGTHLLFVKAKPGVLSATVCLPIEAVFRTILTAFEDSTGDKTLSPSGIQDVLEASKHFAHPISLLLGPNAKQAKLDLIKTKVEERYPNLQLPTAETLEPMNPTDIKVSFTALAGQLKEIQTHLIQSEMKVEEVDLSSVDLQLAAIKLIIGQ